MHLPEKHFWQFFSYVFSKFGRLCENSLVWTRQHCLPIVWLVNFLNFLTHIGQQENNFKKNCEMKSRAFWIWFRTNHFQCNISSLGTFDLYVILTQFVSKINHASTPLSFDSALSSIVDKQPIWLSFFCSVWKKMLTALKVCMDFFRGKLIFMKLTGMNQFHVIKMHIMLSLLMSPLLAQLMR